jgi:hypothetical protein
MTRMETTAPKLPKSLFAYMLFYGGMVTTAGVLGVKQIAIGPLSVEAGIFAFLLLVIMGSAVTELHGKEVADTMVRWGFVPLIAAALLIRLVLILPTDPGMYPPAVTAFPIVVGQGARMMIAGLIAYGTSQTLNVLIFSRLAHGEGNLVWLRGMVASAVSQVVDTLLFITISFYGERPILGLMAGQMLTKVLLSVVLVPWLITFFVAFGRKLDRA